MIRVSCPTMRSREKTGSGLANCIKVLAARQRIAQSSAGISALGLKTTFDERSVTGQMQTLPSQKGMFVFDLIASSKRNSRPR